jgi:hypothetical protein
MVAKLAGTLKLASVVMLLFSLLIAANPAEVIAPTRVAAATTPSVYAPLATAATTLEHFTASTANWNCTAAGLSATNSTSSLNAARSTIFEPLLTSACASSCLHVPLSESSHSSPCIIRDGQVVPLASAVDPPQSSDRDPASAFARSQRRVIHPPPTDAVGTLQLLQRWCRGAIDKSLSDLPKNLMQLLDAAPSFLSAVVESVRSGTLLRRVFGDCRDTIESMHHFFSHPPESVHSIITLSHAHFIQLLSRFDQDSLLHVGAATIIITVVAVGACGILAPAVSVSIDITSRKPFFPRMLTSLFDHFLQYLLSAAGLMMTIGIGCAARFLARLGGVSGAVLHC